MNRSPQLDKLEKQFRKNQGSRLFFPLAEGYRNNGEYEQAVEIYRLGLTNHPNYVSARVSLARTLMELERLDEAKTELEIVVETAHENLMAHKLLAEIYVNQGELPLAIDQFKAILELNPGDRESQIQIDQLSEAIPAMAHEEPPVRMETSHRSETIASFDRRQPENEEIDFDISEQRIAAAGPVEGTGQSGFEDFEPRQQLNEPVEHDEKTDKYHFPSLMNEQIADDREIAPREDSVNDELTEQSDVFFDDSGLDELSADLPDFTANEEPVFAIESDDRKRGGVEAAGGSVEIADTRLAEDKPTDATLSPLTSGIKADVLFDDERPESELLSVKKLDAVRRDTQKLYPLSDSELKAAVEKETVDFMIDEEERVEERVEDEIFSAAEPVFEETTEEDIFFSDTPEEHVDAAEVVAVTEEPVGDTSFFDEVDDVEEKVEDERFLFEVNEEEPVKEEESGQSLWSLGTEVAKKSDESLESGVSGFDETKTSSEVEDDDFAVEFDVVDDEESEPVSFRELSTPQPASTPPPIALVGGDEKTFETETLARLYEGQGHFREAIVVYEKLLLRSPQNPHYFEKIEELRERIREKAALHFDVNGGKAKKVPDAAAVNREVLLQTLARYQRATNVIRSQRGLI